MTYRKGKVSNMHMAYLGYETRLMFDYTVLEIGPLGNVVYTVHLYFPEDETQLPHGDIMEYGECLKRTLDKDDVLYFCREARAYLLDMKKAKVRRLAILLCFLAILCFALFCLVTDASGLATAF